MIYRGRKDQKKITKTNPNTFSLKQALIKKALLGCQRYLGAQLVVYVHIRGKTHPPQNTGHQ